MKKQILLLLVIATFIFIGCDEKKTIIVCDHNEPEVIIATEIVDVRDRLIICKSQYDLINTFRPPVKDVAYYLLSHKDEFKLDKFNFTCGIFRFWVANEEWAFKLDSPTEINFTKAERKYFWNIYTTFRDTEQRLYNWESEIKIIVN